MEISMQNIIESYKLLADPDMEKRQKANLYLLQVTDHQKAWSIAQEVITQTLQPQYQFLGAQILFQKLQRQLTEISPQSLQNLRNFVFDRLSDPQTNLPVARKLAATAALVGVVMVKDKWSNFLKMMISFSQISQHQLRNGLLIIENIPDQLQNNRIKQADKFMIKDILSKDQIQLAGFFLKIIKLQNIMIQNVLQALNSWCKIGFKFLNYSALIVPVLSLVQKGDEQIVDLACKSISSAIQHASRIKAQALDQINPALQRVKYSSQQINSLGIVIQFFIQIKNTVLCSLQKQTHLESVESICRLAKQLMLSCKFLILQPSGYQILSILYAALNCNDLKTSHSTLQFWGQFCEKVGKIQTQPIIQEKIWGVVGQIFMCLLNKSMLQNESLLYQISKQQDTIDDLNKVTFGQYRKQSQNILKMIYECMNRLRKKQGSYCYFKTIADIIANHQSKLIYLQLSIFAVKASLQAIVKDYDIQYLCEYMSTLLAKISSIQPQPTRLVLETINLIKDCSGEIKNNSQLYISAVSICLSKLQDQNLCHYAVYAFQALMQSAPNSSDDSMIRQLLKFYTQSSFKKQLILERVLQAILSLISKLTNQQAIVHHLQTIFSHIQRNMEVNRRFIQVKMVLQSYDHLQPKQQKLFKPQFLIMFGYGLDLLKSVITTCFNNLSSMISVGDLGNILHICKYGLKICEGAKIQQIPLNKYIQIIMLVFQIFQPNNIQIFINYCQLLQIFVKLLIHLTDTNIPILNDWLRSTLPLINQFFINYVNQIGIQKAKTQVLKWLYSIQEALLTYNSQLYIEQENHLYFFDLALCCLQQVNERSLHKKVISYLYFCLKLQNVYQYKLDNTTSIIFSSIPQVQSLGVSGLGKLLSLLFVNDDLKSKQNKCRLLLQRKEFQDVSQDIKQILAKFIAFALDSGVERYIRGVIGEISEVSLKRVSSDYPLHLQMRFTNWKRQFKKNKNKMA